MKIFVILLLFLLQAAVFGQINFQVSGTPRYDVAYEVETCEPDFCYGKLKVVLNQKGRKTVFQTFEMETDFSATTRGKANVRIQYKAQSVVRFDDYDFDGKSDLAIQNGRYGGYNGPSYDIYLFSRAKQKFVANEKLSTLATAPYLGIFDVDRKKNVLRTEQKSGCCMHETEEFRFIKGSPVKVYSRYEDAFTNPKRVKITTKRLIGGKWRTLVTIKKRVE